MVVIRNPWAGYEVGATWAWHKARGLGGGSDYKVPPGKPVRSPAAGRASLVHDGLNSVAVTLADGRSITLRENRSTHGTFPRTVAIGEQLATTGLVRAGVPRWPHIDATVRGVRVPFESLLTTTAGGTIMATVAEIVTGVWSRAIARGGANISALQELANVRTDTIALRAELAATKELVRAVKAPALTEADRKAIATDVAAQVLANMPTKITGTLTK